MRTMILLLLVSLLQSPAAQSDKAVVEGVVTSMTTNAPIAGADVLAISQTGQAGQNRNVTTNEEGRFSLILDPGPYRLIVRQQGYVQQSFGQRSPASLGTPVTLRAGEMKRDAAFRLVPTGTIVGRIYDPDGHPMEGVRVSAAVMGWDASGRRTVIPSNMGLLRQVVTNDLGEYRMYWLPPGDYYISARDGNGAFVPGPVLTLADSRQQRYSTTYYPGIIDPSQATRVNVPPGSEIRGIDFSVTTTRTVTVRGRINMPDVQNMTVTQIGMMPVDPASYAEHGNIAFNEQTRTFSIPNVMPSRYRIVAAVRIPNQRNFTGEVIVDVDRDPVDDLVVTVRPGQTVRGQVTFEDSPSAVKDALDAKRLHVSLRSENAGVATAFLDTSGEVQADGAVSLPDVGVMPYRVSIVGLPPDFYISSARMNGVDLLDRGLQTANVGNGLLQISVSGLGGRVDGRVVDKDGPVADARVVLVPDPNLRQRHELYRIAFADASGRFTMRGIVPGQYKLIAADEIPSGAYFDTDYMRPLEDKTKAFRIEKNDLIQLDVPIIRPSTPELNYNPK